MSYQSTTWAWEQEGLNPTLKLVLLAMANFVSDTGVTYPSVQTVCEMTGLNKGQTVSNAQRKLVVLNLLSDTGKRTGKTGQVKVFRLPEEAWKFRIQRHRQTAAFGPQAAAKTPSNGSLSPPAPNYYPPRVRKGTGTVANATGDASNGSGSKRQLTDAFVVAWQERFGGPYKFQGAKDGKAADSLLATGLSVAEIISIARSAWARLDEFNCKHAMSLAGLSSRFNEIRGEVKSAKRKNQNGSGRGVQVDKNFGVATDLAKEPDRIMRELRERGDIS